MYRFCAKCLHVSSSILIQRCIAPPKLHLLRNNINVECLKSFKGVQRFQKMKRLSFGLLAGCCFSKKNEESEPIANDPTDAEFGGSYGSTHKTQSKDSERSSDEFTNPDNEAIENIANIDIYNALIEDALPSAEISPKPSSSILPSTVILPDSLLSGDNLPTVFMFGDTTEVSGAKYRKLTDGTRIESSPASYNSPIDKPAIASNGSLSDNEIVKNEKSPASSSKTGKRPKKPRPNFFVSMKISNPLIFQGLETVQEHIIEQNPLLKPYMTNLSKLHITLMVFCLNTAEEREKALSVLQSLHEFLNKHMIQNPLRLDFIGLGNFNNKVLFAKIKCGPALDRLIDIATYVRSVFQEASIYSTDERDFNPHLTVMKLRHVHEKRQKAIKKIAPSLYSTYEDHIFGSELIRSIELLSMNETDKTTGYYEGHQLFFDVEEKDTTSPVLSHADELQNMKEEISQFAENLLNKMASSNADINSPNSDLPNDEQNAQKVV